MATVNGLKNVHEHNNEHTRRILTAVDNMSSWFVDIDFEGNFFLFCSEDFLPGFFY